MAMLLQEKLGKGEFNKATTRVLHFKRNPEALAVEKIEQNRYIKMEAENASLKAQLQKAESHSSDAGPSEANSVQSAVKDAEITVLQRQVSMPVRSFASISSDLGYSCHQSHNVDHTVCGCTLAAGAGC